MTTAVWAQAASAPAEAANPVTAEAPVVVANRTITTFRTPYLGVPPERRAQRTEAILRELLDRAVQGEVTIQVEPQGHVLLVDGELALVLVAADADPLRAQTLAQASAAARGALRLALAETREGRDSQRLLWGLGRSLLATLIALAIAIPAWRARRWATVRLTRKVAQSTSSVRLAGAELLHTERLVAAVRLAVRALWWTLALVLVYEWLGYVLRQFPYSRPWGEQLTRYLLGVADHIGRGVFGALPDLLIAVVIFLIARGVIALFRPFFTRLAATDERQGGWLDADTAGPTRRLFSIAVWLFAAVMAYPYLPGAQSEAFKGLSLLIGLMVTLGGSSLFGQAASGLVLMYSRTLRVGEYVRINEHEGTVTEMGAFITRVRTGLGEELTFPNSLVLGSVSKNYSRAVHGRGFVVDTTVTIGYDTAWRRVEAMLIEAARRTPGVLTSPAPRVFHTALSDFYPEYRLVCQAIPSEPRPRAEVLSALHANIQDVFNECGVQIMSPHYLADPAEPKLVPPDQRDAAAHMFSTQVNRS
ncbi:MAG: mechanosensitive ion channel protein MscS [Burkholderiales bacterium PBB1]|nr:MAG: mechanosensitive ion channel protein MscS [Burkholderiales bacterium PBB1]